MGDDITYLDLLILKKIDSQSTIEKFGLKINTSFFDTANLIGSMKLKGLLNIESSVAGQSLITISGDGKDLISVAIQKSSEPIDSLDQTILNALVSGVRDLNTLQKVINLRSKDMAFHLYKLKAYDYIDQSVQSAKVNFSLTEKGFLLTKGYRSSIKASDINHISSSESNSGSKLPSVDPGAPSLSQNSSSTVIQKKSSSIEDEIRELFNFGSFNKKKNQKQSNDQFAQLEKCEHLSNPTSSHSTINPQSSSYSSDKLGSKQTTHQNIPATPLDDSSELVSLTTPPKDSFKSGSSTAIPSILSNQTSNQNVFAYSANPATLKKKKGLDRQKMFFSKLEFYITKYALYIVLILLMFTFVLISVVLALIQG